MSLAAMTAAAVAAASGLDMRQQPSAPAPVGEEPQAEPAGGAQEQRPADGGAANCCYLCNECAQSFASLQQLEAHMAQAHGSDAGACSANGEQEAGAGGRPATAGSNSFFGADGLPRSPTFSDVSGMDDSLRMSNIESPDSSVIDGNKIYTCRFCAATFDARSPLNAHYHGSHADKPLYECDMCDKIYTVKRELSTHRRTHSGEQTHACTECGKEFGTRQLLKKHWMWHDGKRSHICPHCNKAFFQKGHLTQHLMIHTGTRAFQCHLCDKTFIFKFDLNRHMKIHGPDRQNTCDRCGSVFLKPAELRAHADVCTGERPAGSELKTEDPSSGTHTPTGDGETPASGALTNGTPSSASTTPVRSAGAKRKAPGAGGRRAKKTQLNAPTKIESVDGGGGAPASGLFPTSALAAMATPQTAAGNGYTCLLCSSPKSFPTQASYALHLTYYHFRGAMSQAASAVGGGDAQQPCTTAAAGFSGAPPAPAGGIFANAGFKFENMLGALQNNNNNVATTAPLSGGAPTQATDVVAPATSAAPGPMGPLGLLNFNALFSAAAAMAVNSAMEASTHQQGGSAAANGNDRASAASSGSNESGIDMSPNNAQLQRAAAGAHALTNGTGAPACQSCGASRSRQLDLEARLAAKENEVRALRDTMSKAAGIASGLMKSCGDFDKLWMLHTKEVCSQIHAVLANLTD